MVLIFVGLTTLVFASIGLVVANGDHYLGGLIAAAGLTLSLGGALVSYFAGDSILMRIAGAKQIAHQDDPELFNVVTEMALASGSPTPKVYIIPDTALNAFATGRDPEHAAIAITSGLREKLTRDELQGVIAHEMGHVVNYDIRLMMLIAVMAGVIVLLCDNAWRVLRVSRQSDRDRKENPLMLVALVTAIILSIVAPILAKLLQLAVSRNREYLADATAVRLTRNPEGLASALKKLSSDTEVLEAANRATEHLYIVSPTVKLNDAEKDSVWSTHPPIGKRISKLMALAT